MTHRYFLPLLLLGGIMFGIYTGAGIASVSPFSIGLRATLFGQLLCAFLISGVLWTHSEWGEEE